jgi:hypothetical protein
MKCLSIMAIAKRGSAACRVPPRRALCFAFADLFLFLHFCFMFVC